MSWIKVLYTFKILIINILIFLALWFFVEIINYFTNPYNKESNRIVCKYKWVAYNYCPNIIDVKKNTKDDGGELIFSYTNNIGQRVRNPGDGVKNYSKNVFIGDSYIQAEEINFENTFFGILDNEISLTAIGYSSWNLIQYKNVIRNFSFKNTNYHIFMMMNDVTPNYGRSVYRNYQRPYSRNEDIEIPKGLFAEINKAYKNSLTKKISEFSFKKKNSNNLPTLELNNFDINNVYNCSHLETLSDVYKKRLGYDYLVYSKSLKCWEEIYKKAANDALKELYEIKEIVDGLDSNLTIYLIPAGWTFVDQATNGRKRASYFFGDKMTITTEPLFKFFTENLKSVKFVNLEKIFTKWISECINKCQNKFYFSDDGHWTPIAHKYLAQYFLRILN